MHALPDVVDGVCICVCVDVVDIVVVETTPGVPNPWAVDSCGVRALADPASAPYPEPLADPDLVMRVRVGTRQVQVLRLLYTHRLLTAAQVRALAFETATRRTCEICL